MFRDRQDAGRQLAAALKEFKNRDCVILALPRGGVPVASEVAKALSAPLDLLLVRKIGAPGHPELAIGSVIDGGKPIIVRDGELMWRTGTSDREFDIICNRELGEIERRRKFYLGDRLPKPLAGKTVIVVDDGLATGNSMQAALYAVRQRKPNQVVMAVPVAPASSLEKFREMADRIVCLAMPEPFGAVGFFYDDFEQVDDSEVVRLLAEQERRLNQSAAESR